MASPMFNGRLPDEEVVVRVTRDGRKLKYCMNVIQQPERARACGSGAKSSTDRRPVDPPPVVELRIYDVTADSQDVTFAYDANFFLFVTLEVARPMAHGRLPPPAPQIPVLTGMPVSGMAYLDRPAEAGYFIFPDLSVRHEGKYKLSFNLYEETKDPKDADSEPPKEPAKKRPSVPGPDPDSSFDWRMEVKSNPFTVFSAKKFPGLAESTALSKTVAEQGCRVRIRRDVRMRRRDGKDVGDFLEAGEEEYVRPERMSTPAEHEYRRPIEISDKYATGQPRQEQPSRRESIDYSAPPYPQTYTPSSVSSHSSAPSAYHAYSVTSTASLQAPTMQYVQSAAAQQVYQPVLDYHRAGQYRQPPMNSTYLPQHATIAAAREREGYDTEYRRPSLGGYGSTPVPRALQYSHDANKSAPYHGYPSRLTPPPVRSPIDLPPFKCMDAGHERSPTGPLAPVSKLISHEKAPSAYPPYGPVISVQGHSGHSAEQRLGKRSYDTVFNSKATTQSLFNGRRPNSAHGTDIEDEDEDEIFNMEQLKMQYKRADGTRHARPLPSVQ